MKDTITLTKLALANIFDGLINPNPEDPEPVGPIGPIVISPFSALAGILLNPQPLPPRVVPDPWRYMTLSRILIDRSVTQYQFVEAFQAKEEINTDALQSQLFDVVDDWCGTRPPKWPRPWPPKLEKAQIRPTDLLVAAVQFQKAASLNNPLEKAFQEAADRLFKAGLERIEITCS